jgi:repressor LexA
MNPLTVKQKNIFEFIFKRIRNKFPPTIREIADNFNITNGAARDHLKAIEKKGYIKKEYKKSRGIQLNIIELNFSKTGRHEYIRVF